MERIDRPNDDFREKLSPAHLEAICSRHGLPLPRNVRPEHRGNEKVIYHLDEQFTLAFCVTDDVQRNVESLVVLNELPLMPTPRVLAWMKEDPATGVPYIVMERCPGIRLDELWDVLGPRERLAMLEALGAGMGGYHTVSGTDARQAADKVSLSHVVHDSSEQPLRRVEDWARLVYDNLGQLADRLGLLGPAASSVEQCLEARCAEWFSHNVRGLVEPGLVHDEPWAEHFYLEKSEEGFRLSGCVDFEEVNMADALSEVATLYASILGLDREYYEAFRRGYERFFQLPRNHEEAVRLACVLFDAWALVWLTARVPEPIPKWWREWVEQRFRRLAGWLGEAQPVSRALFRRDIGPW
jgi:aminoglycoside phosphotransferase (APT) family kinase protein